VYKDAFNKFSWGFFFIMIGFKIQGFDIFPNIVGYILFALAFNALASTSSYFEKAKGLNVIMAVISIFAIYEKPVQGGGIQFGALGIFGFLIGIVGAILNLFIVYYLFKGIQDIASIQGRGYISEEADKRWTQYLTLQICVLLSFIMIFIPLLNIIYVLAILAASVVLTFVIMGFMKRCGDSLI
jgi:hypothetical protein